MRIAFDVDNVICNTAECVINYINERIPTVNLKMEDIKEYWMEKALPEEYRWIVPLAFEQSDMWKNVKMINGARQVIRKLYNEGHEIYFVTATTANNFRKKISFLERNLDFFPEGYVRHNAISLKRKQLLNVDFLIDDCLDNLLGQRTYISLCYDYPWNRNQDEMPDFKRVYNWIDIWKYLCLLN